MPSKNLGEYLTEICEGKLYSKNTKSAFSSRSSDTLNRLESFVDSLWGLRVNFSLYTKVLEALSHEKVPEPLPRLHGISLEKMGELCTKWRLGLALHITDQGKKSSPVRRYKTELLPEIDALREISWTDLKRTMKTYQAKMSEGQNPTPSSLYIGERGHFYQARIEVSPHTFGKMFFDELEDEKDLTLPHLLKPNPKPRLTLLGYELRKYGLPLENSYKYVAGPYTLEERGEINWEEIEKNDLYNSGGIPAGMIDWMELLALLHKIEVTSNHVFVIGKRQGVDSYHTHRSIVEFKSEH